MAMLTDALKGICVIGVLVFPSVALNWVSQEALLLLLPDSMCKHVPGGSVPQAVSMWAVHYQIKPRKHCRAVNEPVWVGGYAQPLN